MRASLWREDALVVLAMAAGLGLAAAILSAVWSLLVQPLPFGDPDRLVLIESADRGLLSNRELREIGQRLPLLSAVAGFNAGAAYNMSSGDQPEEVPAVITTRELFEVLEVPLQFGEPWPESFDRQRDFGVVLSDRLFRTRFGGDPSIVGQSITLDAYPGYRVFGVTAPGFEFPADRWMYRSSGIFPDRIDAIDFRVAQGVARMTDGTSLAQVQQGLDRVARQLQAEFPEAHGGLQYRVRPLADLYVGQLRPAMLLLCGAVALLLLLAIVNSAHSFAARMYARQGRIALQLALGAPPGRLMRALFGRALVLSLLGALLGLAVAAASVDLLWRGLADTLPKWMQIDLAIGPVLSILLLAVLAAALASAWPMRRLMAVDPASCLQDGGQRRLGSPKERRQQRGMLAVQVALALVLVGVGAQFALDALRAQSHPSGFASEGRVSFRVALPWAKYDVRTEAPAQLYDQLGDELGALPGVQRVAWGTRVPATSDRVAPRPDIHADLRLAEQPEQPLPWQPQINRVSESYFDALGIALLAGRGFQQGDRPDTPAVAVVSRGLAARLWPGRDPLGAELLWPAADGSRQSLSIVGMVDDVRYDLSVASPAPMLYLPARQRPDLNHFVVLQHAGPAPTDAQLRAAMARVDPEQSLFDLASMERLRDQQLWQSSLLAQLLTVLGACAWVLVAVGLAGLSRLWTVQRRRDMAVRAALGADAARLYRDSLSEVLRVLGLGIAIGLPLLLLLRWLSSQLLILPQLNSPLLLPVLVLALLLALLLVSLPAARQVAASQPAEALR